ncbi:hypothetical protein YTPLAS18_00580 [Nitrospira sp.]|nr:hypothetical protein YTPLAS18_00580 [Nitrospira sp.]
MASHTPNQSEPSNHEQVTVKEVELLRVLVSRTGQAVSAEWAIHPQLKHDLRPEEWKEVVDLMGKVTTLVGGRFKRILSEVEPDAPGNA